MKKVTTLLKLVFILMFVGGASYKCLSTGHKHYANQAESGLAIPSNATDINVYKALTNWYCFDFKTDFENYKKWVDSFTQVKLSEITQSTSRIISYSKKQNKILFRENVKHFRASWKNKDSETYLMYVPEEGRAYYATHNK